MKTKTLAIMATILLVTYFSQGQILFGDLGINGPADSSASVEVRSTTRGFLPPVLSTEKRRAIKNPRPGLLVFDSTKNMFYGYTKGAGWRPFVMGVDSISYAISDPSAVAVGDLSNGDQLGVSVAINGNIALATAPTDDVNANADQGSVYVFRKINGSWQNTQKIFAPDGAAGDQFGSSVVMTNRYVFVSAIFDDVGENLDQGSVYVYKIENDSLNYLQKISGSAATQGDLFGYGLAVQNEQLFVGAPNDDIGLNLDQGSVYSFRLNNGNWVETQKIIQDSATAGQEYFGMGMSIDSNFASIGGHINISSNYGYGQNAVFIYENVNGTWVRRQKILQPDVASNYKNDAFGYSTSLKNGVLSVGAWLNDVPAGNKDRGSMYVFKKEGNNWNYIQKVSPADVNPGDTYGDYFGYNMSQYDNVLIGGNGYEDLSSGNPDRGAFYIMNWDGTQWVINKKVMLPSPVMNDFFGHAVGVNGSNIIIGAYQSNNAQGKVYFYSLNSN